MLTAAASPVSSFTLICKFYSGEGVINNSVLLAYKTLDKALDMLEFI